MVLTFWEKTTNAVCQPLRVSKNLHISTTNIAHAMIFLCLSIIIHTYYHTMYIHVTCYYSLDALVANSDSAEIILDVRRDIDKAYVCAVLTAFQPR